MENISKELNYSPVVNNHSSIVYRFVSPQAGGNVSLNASSPVGPTEFLIPPSCWIPELTKLNFSISVPAQAAKANFINGNLLSCIDRITVYDTATSNVVLDCSNFHKYVALTSPAATKLDEYLTKPVLTTVTPATAALSNPFPVEEISKSNISTVNDNPINTDMGPFNPLLGRRQYYVGAAPGVTLVNVSIPFKAFKLTALSSNKIWYSPSSLVVQVYFSAVSNFVHIATAITDPMTGGAAVVGTVTIGSPQLVLANEGNLAIVSQVINKVMSGGGIQLPIAYPTVVQTTTTASTSNSFQYQLTRGYGNRILALITAPFYNDAAPVDAGTTFAAQNWHPRYVAQYNTFLNNVAIRSQAGFVGQSSTLAATDYGIGQYPYLEGSVIQNIYEYANGEFVHIDGFFGNKSLHSVDQHQVDGLDVTAQSSTWQWVATTLQNATPADQSFRYFTAIIGQKTMTLSAQGVMVQ